MRSIKKLREEGFVIAPATEGVGLVKIQAPKDQAFYYYNPRFEQSTRLAVNAMQGQGAVNHIFTPASSYNEASDQLPFVILYPDQYLAMVRQVQDENSLLEQQVDIERRLTCIRQAQQLYKRDREEE